MRDDLAEIAVVMDVSGSMDSVKNDAIGGFNSFLKEQQALQGEARLTLVLFNTESRTIYDGVPISQVRPLSESTYVPNGFTALFDAVGDAVDVIGERLAGTPEDERPGKVIVAIITDGEENSSKRFTSARIKEMIGHQQSTYNWHFLFLAANQDAVLAGGTIGIKAGNCVSYTSDSIGTKTAYGVISSFTTKMRRDHLSID